MTTLKVYPNPFSAFDKNGIPCGLCPRDPEADAGGPGHFVGARVDRDKTKVLQDFAAEYEKRWGKKLAQVLARNETRTPRQVTYYEFMGVSALDPNLAELLAAKEPIELPLTKYYKDRLREGAILPADQETATAAKLKRFQSPATLLAHLQPKPQGTDLPETPGLEPLPQSPDADGNLLEAPALPDGQTRGDGIEAVADGTFTTLNADAPSGKASPVTSKQRNRSEA